MGAFYLLAELFYFLAVGLFACVLAVLFRDDTNDFSDGTTYFRKDEK